ncbi:MAG TPA: hypothetical protein VNZ53_56215 [Steroidobacteraceae bacterium]|nr:hypothetical protein [Steroidobacteraceae bacterium]
MSEHTPGPWIADDSGSANVISIRHDAQNEYAIGDEICSVYAEDGELTDRHRADASLIAAAPEMLRALELGVAWRRGHASLEDFVNAAIPIVDKFKQHADAESPGSKD